MWRPVASRNRDAAGADRVNWTLGSPLLSDAGAGRLQVSAGHQRLAMHEVEDAVGGRGALAFEHLESRRHHFAPQESLTSRRRCLHDP